MHVYRYWMDYLFLTKQVCGKKSLKNASYLTDKIIRQEKKNTSI